MLKMFFLRIDDVALTSRPYKKRSKIIKGAKMVDHEMRRKIIRQWMSLSKDKRQTPEQAADFARKAVEQNELQPSRQRDKYHSVPRLPLVIHRPADRATCPKVTTLVRRGSSVMARMRP
jgi:hypothetical protein